jgi:hypothetical protein
MFNVPANTKKSSVSAVVTRADGTQVKLGTIAFYHRNSIINFIGNLYITIKRKVKG